MVRPDSVLNSWKAVREDTAQAVEDFSAQPLDYKPAPELMSFGEIARHILEAGYALTGMLLDGVDNLATPQFREMLHKQIDRLPKTEGPGALARELRAAMETRLKELAAQPAGFFSGEITRMDGQRATRLEVIQMMKEHELTHRAQLFVYLRLKGMVPPTTRRRSAKANA
ncbi:MAG TPA: DinB family protein [Bryobacteraceae bacterium]|nr:DinB family protein [Bryobacteraceae bacterium]